MGNAADNHNTLTYSGGTKAEGESDLALRDCRTGRHYRLHHKRQEIVLGCADTCDIVVSDPYASGVHCSLQRSLSSGWLLRDHSKNGTRINGIRVRVAELRAGSQFSIGGTCFELTRVVGGAKATKLKILGKAPIFVEALHKALRAARTNCSVLLLGETGTGKDLFARAIHEESRRSKAEFVAINCGTFPSELIRSELFGHTKGAFTGASVDQEGLFRQANGGTLFLDEIGELPRQQQPHLLRALESGLIRKVGGRLEELVDVRVVAATNRTGLAKRSSPLRLDLFHRLSTVVVEIPSLRHRREDIPMLVDAFLRLGLAEYGERNVEPSVLEKLSQHDWTGNVRELHNSVNRAMALGGTNLVVGDFLPDGVSTRLQNISHSPAFGERSSLTSFQRTQRQLLREAYRKRRSIRAAAEYVGMPKSTFSDLCRRYGIETKKKKRGQ